MDTMRRAELAQQLINNDVFKECINSLKDDCLKVWQTSQPDQAAVREDMYNLTLALAHIESRLQSFIDSGKLLDDRNKNLTEKGAPNE